jgi:thioredoxin 1
LIDKKTTMGFNEIVASDTPVLIDFYADWCGPCKAFSPIIQEVKNDLGEAVKIIKINVDTNEALSSKLGIMSIPTIHIYRNGKLEWHAAGLQTKQFLIDKIQEIASL